MQQQIKSLHIIRGIAALLVVVYHSKFVLWSGGDLWMKQVGFRHFYDYLFFAVDMLTSCGSQCVLVFFVLSGFVIYHSFQQSDSNLKHFYIVRVLRIYIPFLVSLLLSVIVLQLIIVYQPEIVVSGVREFNTRLSVAASENNLNNVFRTVFFLPGREYAGFNFAYWSLLHEAVFYLVFPIYFYAGVRKRILLFIILLMGYFFTKNVMLYYQLYFLAGMFLYDYYLRQPAQLLKRAWVYLPLIFLGFCLTNFLVKATFYISADLLAFATVLLCFDYLLLRKESSNRYLKLLANMSFSLYLNHLWILLIWYALCTEYFGKLILYDRSPYFIGIIFSLGISWIFYRLVEFKSLALIRKVKLHWRQMKA